MKEIYQDKIDAYVRHEMTDEERQQFEQELASNEELRDQLDYTLLLKRRLKSRQEKLQRMREWAESDKISYADVKAADTEPKATTTTPKRKTNHRTLYWLSGIAAIAIVGYFLFVPSTGGIEDDGIRGDDDVFMPSPVDDDTSGSCPPATTTDEDSAASHDSLQTQNSTSVNNK